LENGQFYTEAQHSKLHPPESKTYQGEEKEDGEEGEGDEKEEDGEVEEDGDHTSPHQEPSFSSSSQDDVCGSDTDDDVEQ
jgi:hypothetical protein